jgi:hypothetical protein
MLVAPRADRYEVQLKRPRRHKRLKRPQWADKTRSRLSYTGNPLPQTEMAPALLMPGCDRDDVLGHSQLAVCTDRFLKAPGER